MSERYGLPRGEFNMPPGVSMKDEPGNRPEPPMCQWREGLCDRELTTNEEIRMGLCQKHIEESENEGHD